TSDAFLPYDPLNQPKQVAGDLWIIDGHEVRKRSFGLRIPFPTRMTVVRLPDGGLWIHSPVAPDEALFEAIERLGSVS
ncbi:DUF4336 domain-containing protein, partial [Acinetobacter baumannii]